MAKRPIGSFDDASAKKIAEAVREQHQQLANLKSQLDRLTRDTHLGWIHRTGITTVNDQFPSYPSDGCQFVVQFEDWTWNEAVGECADLDRKAWEDKFVLARTLDGSYLERDTKVAIFKMAGKQGRRWYIIPIDAQILTCRTTVNATFPDYPVRPANKFVCEVGEVIFAESPGCEVPTFVPAAPRKTFVAIDSQIKYWPRGSIVAVFKRDKRYHILGAIVPELGLATITDNLCGEDSPSALVEHAILLPHCEETDQIDRVENPRAHRAPAGSQVLFVGRHCLPDGSGSGSGTGHGSGSGTCGTQVWEIVDVRKRKVCQVNYLKNVPGKQFGYGSIVVAGEWCDDGDLCKLWNWRSCSPGSGSGTSGSGSGADWTFVLHAGACCDE